MSPTPRSQRGHAQRASQPLVCHEDDGGHGALPRPLRAPTLEQAPHALRVGGGGAGAERGTGGGARRTSWGSAFPTYLPGCMQATSRAGQPAAGGPPPAPSHARLTCCATIF